MARRGLSFVIAGRDAERLRRLRDALEAAHPGLDVPIRVATPTEPRSLVGLFDGVEVVVNTVGPFTDLGEPVVKAALDQKVHYLDTTGEQAYMLRIRDRYDAIARHRGCVIVCAHAFEYALGDCASALALQALGGQADSVDAFYFAGGQVGISPGTAQSLVRALAGPCVAWDRGALVRTPVGTSSLVTLPGQTPRTVMEIPGGEALGVPRYGEVASVRSWVGVGSRMARAIRVARPALPITRFAAVRTLCDGLIRALVHAPADGTPTTFQVAARAVRGSSARWCVLTGRDPYGLTALICAEGAQRLLEAPRPTCGVVSTAMAFEPAGFLDALPSPWIERVGP
jgi:short subunit dehydrogenase-like uncharacterized protein